MSHTPAPWSISDYKPAYGGVSINSPYEETAFAQWICSEVAIVRKSSDAALITAAPELLNVAQHCLYLIEKGLDISPAGLADLRAAIANATRSAA